MTSAGQVGDNRGRQPSAAPKAGADDVDMVERLRQVTADILSSHPYGFLLTASNARLVAHLPGSGTGEVWIGTSPRSRKAADLRETGHAAYAVEDRGRFGYVSFYGDAALVDDPAALQSRWSESLRPFFPEGALGGDFVLLRIVPLRIELMSFADTVHPDPYGLCPAVIVRSSSSGPWTAAGSINRTRATALEDRCP